MSEEKSVPFHTRTRRMKICSPLWKRV